MKRGPGIGPVVLENPFVLAPMAGISDPPFRRLCRRAGAAMVCAEMVSANALHHGDEKSLAMLRVFPDEHPVSLQVFGSDPDRLADAARRAEAAGADLVDLNCGCPVPKIAGNGAGASLLENESLFGRIVEKMAGAVRIPVTVKMRIGKSPGENRSPRFARVAQEAGAAAVAVHARPVSARHGGPPDLGALRETVDAVDIPVIGNGGVATAGEAARMMEETGCAAVMVAQAAIGNPFLFRELLNPPPEVETGDAFDTLRVHARLNTEYYGEDRGLKRLRKCLASYVRGVPGAASLRNRLLAAETLKELLQILGESESYALHPVHS